MGRLETAAELYTRALELDPPFGKHLLLSNRSGVLLSLGRAAEAARDADEASAVAPSGFKNSFIRQVCQLNLEGAILSLLYKGNTPIKY